MRVNKKRLMLVILCILLVFVFMFIINTITFDNNNDIKNDISMNLNFKDRKEAFDKFDAGDLYKIGWLQVQGTNIDLPILDSNSYELVDSVDYSYGWRSPVYVTGENREVLVGHNIINVSSTPMLSNDNLKNFESLMSFVYAGFAKDNLYIQYTKNGKEELYMIYAIGFYDYYYDNAESMNNKDKIKKYINDVRSNSIYDYEIDVNENDSLLTVKTCTRYFGNDSKQQFVVDARKVRDDEKIIKYQVKVNDNFEELINNSNNG